MTFAPTNAASFSNLAVFTSNGGNSSNLLTGVGLTPAQLAVAPASLNFGIVAVGANAQASFLVTHLGRATLSNRVVSLISGPFTVLSAPPSSPSGFGSTT